MTFHERKEAAQHKPWKFALGTTAACGLVLAAPLLGPRLLAGTRWDEPDVKPSRKVQEPGAVVQEIQWSHDAGRMTYLAVRLRGRSWEERECTRIERSWPQLEELSRRVVENDDESLPPGYASDSSRGDARKDGLTLRMSQGRRVQSTLSAGRTVARFVARSLELRRQGRLVRSWPVADAPLFSTRPESALLSPDGKLVLLLTSTEIYTRSRSDVAERDLWDVPRHSESEGLYRYQIYRVSDGGLARSGSFSGKVRGVDARGGLWIQRLPRQVPVLFDGRALWFALAPYHLPRDAQARFKQAKAIIAGGYPMRAEVVRAYEQAINLIRSQTQSSNELVLFDALSGRSRTLAPSRLKLAGARRGSEWLEQNMTWDSFGFSPDGKLAKAKLSGSGSTEMLAKAGWGAVHVWDFHEGRGLWQSTPAEGAISYVTQAEFSPDSRLLAYSVDRIELGSSAPVASITVAEAGSGRALGTPLLEDSPAQRFERARLSWQRPLQSKLRRFLREPIPNAPRAGGRLTAFDWAPDSRHIMARHEGTTLKAWRVR